MPVSKQMPSFSESNDRQWGRLLDIGAIQFVLFSISISEYFKLDLTSSKSVLLCLYCHMKFEDMVDRLKILTATI